MLVPVLVPDAAAANGAIPSAARPGCVAGSKDRAAIGKTEAGFTSRSTAANPAPAAA
jgi:hypothetical protein